MGRYLIGAILALSLVGCVSHLIPMGDGIYMSSKHFAWIGTGEGALADAVENADEFCAKQGDETAKVISEKHSMWAGGHGHAEVMFKCMPRSD